MGERGLDRSGSGRGKWPAFVSTVVKLLAPYVSSKRITGFTGRTVLRGV